MPCSRMRFCIGSARLRPPHLVSLRPSNPAGHTPDWFYPSIAEYSKILEIAGLEVREAMLFDRPTKLEGNDGMEDWLKMFVKSLTGDELKLAVETLRPTQWNGDHWTVDYRRIRVKAVKL